MLLKKINTVYILLVLVAASLITSCGGNASSDPVFQTILLNENGHLRGSKIGDPIQDVEKREDSRGLKESENEYLYYEFFFSEDESYTVTYNFYENRLIEIIVSVYINTESGAKQLFENFNERFNTLYGSSHLEDDGFLVWNTKADNGNAVEVAMIKDYEEGSYGYVEIRFNDLDY
ncbi:MAG: hypothetical protein HUU48_01015 [Flavobacteriales bacterium]|nr:hypothetical protein [Flavobacteriales bacterium]